MKIFKDGMRRKTPTMHQKNHCSKNLCMLVIISNIIILIKLSRGRVYAWLNETDQISDGQVGWAASRKAQPGRTIRLTRGTKLRWSIRGEKVNTLSPVKETVFHEQRENIWRARLALFLQQRSKNPPTR